MYRLQEDRTPDDPLGLDGCGIPSDRRVQHHVRNSQRELFEPKTTFVFRERTTFEAFSYDVRFMVKNFKGLMAVWFPKV